MRSYYKEHAWHGTSRTLIIRAVPLELHGALSELLCTSFLSASSQLRPFSAYLSREIKEYVRVHAALPPKAVILCAISHSEVSGVP
jgi:hypothetical protein